MAKITKILIAVIACGAILRIISILNRGPFRFDEIFTLHFSAYPLKNFFWIFHETNPPFFYFFFHFWTKIFGANEIISRIPALIFGLLSILLIYFIGKKFFSPKVGLTAALLICFSSFQIFLSTEARMYSCLFFFSLLSIYFFWQWINTSAQKYRHFWFISSLILVFTHLTGWLIIISQMIYFLIIRRLGKFPQKLLYQCFGTILILIVLFSFWFVPSLLNKTDSSLSQAWFFHTPKTSFYFFDLMRSFLVVSSTLPIADLIFNCLLIVFLCLFVCRFRKGENNKWTVTPDLTPLKFYLLYWLFLPLLIGFVLQINYSFYFAVAAGALYLIIAISLQNLDKFLSKIFLSLLFICLLPTVCFILTASNSTLNMLKWVENQEKPGDKIIVHSFNEKLTYQYYFRGQIPIEGFYPLEDNLMEDLRIVKRNWQNIVDEKNVEKLNFYTKDYQRIFLILRLGWGLDPEQLVLDWFYKNNWRLADKKAFYGVDGATVFLFGR